MLNILRDSLWVLIHLRWIRPFRKQEITGVPIKGIVSIQNPFTVFTILYDYFKIKGNH